MKKKLKKNISFIIPAYNCENTIEQTINSIYDTNFFDGDEVVVTNDASTDNTVKILNKLKKKFKELKVINHKYNKGGGAARNSSVENSKNELIFCLDSDNILDKNSINNLKKYLINKEADVASFKEIKFFRKNKKNISHSWIFEKKTYVLDDYFSTCKVPGASGNYLFTKKSWIKIGGYPTDLKSLDTWGFGFKQVINNFKIVTMPNSFYYHRLLDNSYWVRESKNNNLSLLATQAIIPYLNSINKNIVSYIFSKKGMYSWFEEIESKKIISLSKKKDFLSVFRKIVNI